MKPYGRVYGSTLSRFTIKTYIFPNKVVKAIFSLFSVSLLFLGCQSSSSLGPLPTLDLIQEEKTSAETEYVYGHSGICGVIEADGLRVTRCVPGSAAEGKVLKGDLIEKIWKYPFSSMAKKGMHRSREDFWGTMRLSINRPKGRGETRDLTIYLTLPPLPGEIYAFGPTGIRAELHPGYLKVVNLGENSPAEKKLLVGDIIKTVNGRALGDKVLHQFAQEIDYSETDDAAGLMRFGVERVEGDKTENLSIEIQLRVLGTYSSTAPYNCPKTDALITETAERTIERGNYGRIGVDLLGLLATGEKKFIDHVGEVLKGSKQDKLNMYAMGSAWRYSFRLITLCEYFLLTKDKEILPMIEALAIACAEGQDAAGLWNHRGANPEANFGKKHGRLYGYGAINQTSIAMLIGLHLAEKCGIQHPEVEMAVKKTYGLYKNWIGKGALPYGNHGPNEGTNNNNGTSGSVAVAFALLGDLEGARYYSMLSAASHPEIMTGHASPFFNPLWTAMGSHFAGPDVASEFYKKTKWLRSITRTAEGDYYSQGQSGVGKLGGLGESGSALLQYCLGRKAIFITGKEMDQSIWVRGDEAKELVALSENNIYELSDRELMRELGSPLPQRRLRAAQTLKLNNARVQGELKKYLVSGTRNQKLGACGAVEVMKLKELYREVLNIVVDRSENLWVREKAVRALRAMGESAKDSVPILLELIVEEEDGDPLRDLDRALGFAVSELAPDPYALDLDRELFYKAVNKLLSHKHMNGRDAGIRMIQAIPPEEFHKVADMTRHIIEDMDLSYTAYQGLGAMTGALKIWARLNIADGVDHAFAPLSRAVGKGGFKHRMLMNVLPEYKGHAKPALPRIKEMNTSGRFSKPWKEMIEMIESSPEPEVSLTFEEAKKIR